MHGINQRGVLFVAGLALGCGANQAPSSIAPPPSPTTPGITTAAASSTIPPAPEPNTVGAELSLVAERRCELRLFVLKGRTIAWCAKDLLVVDESGSLVDEPTLAAGLGLDAPGISPPQHVAMAGRWPDAAWAATTEVSGNGNSSRLRFFRWRKARWVPSATAAELGGPMSWVVFPWQTDGMAALAPTPFGPTRVLSAAAALPALTPAVQSKADRESYPCKHALIAPEAWVELSPGDVMVFAGQLCGVPTAPNGDAVQARHLGVERLRAGAKQGEITLLPVPSGLPADVFWNVDGAAALSATDAYVAAGGTGGHFYLAHYDGEGWQQESAPFTTLSGLWAQAKAYWATDSLGTSWLRQDGRWLSIDWRAPIARDAAEGPRHEVVSQIIALDEETTWLVRREERGHEVTSRIYRVKLEP